MLQQEANQSRFITEALFVASRLDEYGNYTDEGPTSGQNNLRLTGLEHF